MRTVVVAIYGAFLSVAAWAGQVEDEALIEATKAGDLRLVKDALGKGASVNAKSSSGMTALMYATLWRRLDVAEELVGRGATLNSEMSGCTAMCMAVLRRYPELIAFLMAKGGKVGSVSSAAAAGLFVFGFMKPAEFESMQAAGKIEPVIEKDPSKPDFSGTWILDRKRSTYRNSPKLPETTLTVSHLGKYLIGVWNSSLDGYIIDGGETVKQNDRDTVTRTAVKWQESALVFSGSLEEKKKTTQTESTWRLEDGGKQLKITRETKGPKPGSADLMFVRTGQSAVK